MARLKKKYVEEIVPKLKQELGLANTMQVPRIEKIVVNSGVGKATENAKLMENVERSIGLACGQKPVITRARKAIASFKIREGLPIGVKVTLRKDRMYEFYDRLVNIALPRVRDFKGLSPKMFDGKGNYTFGIRDFIIFPEIQFDNYQVFGANITIQTSATDDNGGRSLLKAMGFPFR